MVDCDTIAAGIWGAPADVHRRLAGHWRFTRQVVDQAAAQGTAAFTEQAPARLSYRETGRLRVAGGATLTSHRAYTFDATPDGFAVFFAEAPARLFHTVRLSAGPAGDLVAAALHHCADDTYRTTYIFAPDGGFQITHTVTGPKKGYTMVTHYRRAG